MTEEEARAFLRAHFDPERIAVLAQFGDLVIAENERQNLISPASVASMWTRHLCDSAQLLLHADAGARRWLDVGTGAGFPGLVVAVLRPDLTVDLVEPRLRRVEFLTTAITTLNVTNAAVHKARVEAVDIPTADVISARAVTSLSELLEITARHRAPHTQLIFPRGRGGAAELHSLQSRHRLMFHVEHSVTDADSSIIIARGVTH